MTLWLSPGGGGGRNLALKSNGTVVSWGLNTEGVTNVPPTLTNAVQIAAGDVHNLALAANGPPVEQVVVTNFGMSSNGFALTVPTQNGRVFQLQYKTSLASAVWQSLPLNAGTGGTGGPQRLTDPTLAPARFYRVNRW